MLIFDIFLTKRVYKAGIALVFISMLGFVNPLMFVLAKICTGTFVLFLLLDGILLFIKKPRISARRITSEKFSLGEQNPVTIQIEQDYDLKLQLTVIDEAPVEFQERNIRFEIAPGDNTSYTVSYNLRPLQRGNYVFGRVLIYANTFIGLVQRRFAFHQNEEIKVYPSIMHMRDTEFKVMSRSNLPTGTKKVRRAGHHFEFEEIRDYVQGDDIRKINWKATARKNNLMINVFQEQKSQPVYLLINKGRTMYMPFNGLTLLDYAINSSLAIANILLKKSDKAGLISFEKGISTLLKADSRRTQLKQILEHLYNEKTAFAEPNYYDLYAALKQQISQRSLLLFFTNFESLSSLEHQLPIFQRLNKIHLPVIIFFENMELKSMLQQKPQSMSQIYQHSIAEKFDLEKRSILKLLRKHGIQSILTSPQNLTMDVINKYLEIKERGLI